MHVVRNWMNTRKTTIRYGIAEFASSKWKVFSLLRQGDFYASKKFHQIAKVHGSISLLTPQRRRGSLRIVLLQI